MSLTDDWNTGKLDSGWYFVKIDNQVYPDYYNNYFVQSGDVDGLRVLAPCDYDHISELEKKAKKYDRIKVNGNYPDKISRLKSRIKHLLDLQANQDKEVEKLRELLWECLSHLSSDGFSVTPLNILLDKINEVLGNDK